MNRNDILSSIAADAVMVMGMLMAPMTVCAEAIEHQGDRYVINVEELGLSGDESLLDLLMMCPDFVVDGAGETVDNSLLGKWAVRIDNLDIPMSQRAALAELKASDIEKVKVCNYPGVMKGSGGLNKVIDINLRRKENGTHGKVSVAGDSYGKATAYTHAIVQRDNMQLIASGQGEWSRDKQEGLTSHTLDGDAYAHLNWDMTDKDNLVVTLGQQYASTGEVNSRWGYDRYATLGFVYTRALADNGAYALLQANADYSTTKPSVEGVHATYPYAIVEFGFPFFMRNLYVTAGIESGYSATTSLDDRQTDRSRYEDGYVQLDYSVGKWTFSVGDRLRVFNFWFNDKVKNDAYEYTTSNHAYHVMAMHRLDERNVLKGTFARRYYNPDNYDFVYGEVNGMRRFIDHGQLNKYKAYIAELNYTYTSRDLTVGTQVKNVRQDTRSGHDNVLGLGASAFWHKGDLRVTGGANYYHQKATASDGECEYQNYVVLKLAPSLELPYDFRVSSTMIYASKLYYNKVWNAYNGEYATNPGNFFASLTLEKEIGRHWEVEADFHNIADQRLGQRGVEIGVTYYWGGRK